MRKEMRRKLGVRFAIILPILLILAVGSWYGVNKLVARNLQLLEFVEIGDADGVEYMCRWDPAQISKLGTHDCRVVRMILLHYVSSTETVDGIATMYGVKKQWIVAANSQLRHGVELSELREIQIPIDFMSRPCTPLLCAAGRGNAAIVRALLERGADPNVFIGNESALMRCASSPSPQRAEICRLLLEFGADPKWQPGLGGMPLLHRAAGSGDPTLINLLLDQGLDANEVWLPGRIRELREEMHSPLDMADDQRVRKLLRARGAKSSAELAEQRGEGNNQ